MTNKTIRKWAWVHKWSSLVSTLFLLMLCVTGLPLIFHHEIDHLLHEEAVPADLPPGAPFANLDDVAGAALAKHPGKAIQFVAWDDDEPFVTMVFVNERADGDPQKNRILQVDSRTAKFLDEPDFESRLTTILLRLHVDMFAGLPGKLFLGAMGLLFIVAIVSGIVVYAPSMRKLEFGTVRKHRLRPVRWLDLHNLIGIVTVAWALVVGLTGVINTWADLVIKYWQQTQLVEMLGPHRDKGAPGKLYSLDGVVATARKALPDMEARFVAYPGTIFASAGHYVVFMAGKEPVTSRLLKPVVVDAETGAFTDSRDMPWYVTTLLISQPLHFGDYGGMPLKILWALLDIMTIAVLITGLYLWLFRRRSASNKELIDTLAMGEREPNVSAAE